MNDLIVGPSDSITQIHSTFLKASDEIGPRRKRLKLNMGMFKGRSGNGSDFRSIFSANAECRPIDDAIISSAFYFQKIRHINPANEPTCLYF